MKAIYAVCLLATSSLCFATESVKCTEYSFILKPSSVSGVGIFATHDIPAGTQVLNGKFSPRKVKIKDIPAEFLTYCMYLNEEECLAPKRFDRMEIGWYLNHSDKPNISFLNQEHLFAIRDIKAGEEILLNYNEFEEPEQLKESYYWTPESNAVRDGQ